MTAEFAFSTLRETNGPDTSGDVRSGSAAVMFGRQTETDMRRIVLLLGCLQKATEIYAGRKQPVCRATELLPEAAVLARRCADGRADVLFANVLFRITEQALWTLNTFGPKIVKRVLPGGGSYEAAKAAASELWSKAGAELETAEDPAERSLLAAKRCLSDAQSRNRNLEARLTEVQQSLAGNWFGKFSGKDRNRLIAFLVAGKRSVNAKQGALMDFALGPLLAGKNERIHKDVLSGAVWQSFVGLKRLKDDEIEACLAEGDNAVPSTLQLAVIRMQARLSSLFR